MDSEQLEHVQVCSMEGGIVVKVPVLLLHSRCCNKCPGKIVGTAITHGRHIRLVYRTHCGCFCDHRIEDGILIDK